MHPGDLDWWVVGAVGSSPAIEDRVRLWFDTAADSNDAPGALRAYAWLNMAGQLDFQLASDERDEVDQLVRAMVAWAAERRATVTWSRKLGPLTVWASAHDPAATVLSALGLEPSAKDQFVYLTGDLSIADRWEPPTLPAGLSFREMTDSLVEARIVCSRAAFEGSTMTAERYRTTFDANLYRRELDLLVVNDEGRVVAFALGWLDSASGVVELEPVGVHPDFHRRGLGRQICQAVLRRARELGAARAVIGAERDNPASVGLYQSLGLSITTEIVAYERESAAD
jgi:ribosomal protein S18 acetylase RimI-like enzyme